MTTRRKAKPAPNRSYSGPPEPGVSYEELLDRLKHGAVPRPGHCRAYPPSSLEEKLLRGYGYAKAAPLDRKRVGRGSEAVVAETTFAMEVLP